MQFLSCVLLSKCFSDIWFVTISPSLLGESAIMLSIADVEVFALRFKGELRGEAGGVSVSTSTTHDAGRLVDVSTNSE